MADEKTREFGDDFDAKVVLSSGIETKLTEDVGTEKQFDIVEVDCGVDCEREPTVNCLELIGVKDVLVTAIVDEVVSSWKEVEESSAHDIVLGAEAG